MSALESRNACNAARITPGDTRGHYESYFQRANHPDRPLAFWIRYTVLVPRGRPEDALGELWAIYFDGERGRTLTVKEQHPMARCSLSHNRLGVRIGPASLEDGSLRGAAQLDGHRIGWTLDYDAPEEPLLLLPEDLYAGGFPRAKALVGAPNARFRGALQVDGEEIDVVDWQGSQNHNWGERHTDHYAWGQVAGFDDAPDAFFEVSTARIRLGPLWSPFMTLMVLRLDGQEHRCNSLGRALLARGRFSYFDWHFARSGPGLRISGRIDAAREAFVALAYDNPPGGQKLCLNTKIARCEITVARAGQPPRVLHSAHRTAFEILTDDLSHGLSPSA